MLLYHFFNHSNNIIFGFMNRCIIHNNVKILYFRELVCFIWYLRHEPYVIASRCSGRLFSAADAFSFFLLLATMIFLGLAGSLTSILAMRLEEISPCIVCETA